MYLIYFITLYSIFAGDYPNVKEVLDKAETAISHTQEENDKTTLKDSDQMKTAPGVNAEENKATPKEENKDTFDYSSMIKKFADYSAPFLKKYTTANNSNNDWTKYLTTGDNNGGSSSDWQSYVNNDGKSNNNWSSFIPTQYFSGVGEGWTKGWSEKNIDKYLNTTDHKDFLSDFSKNLKKSIQDFKDKFQSGYVSIADEIKHGIERGVENVHDELEKLKDEVDKVRLEEEEKQKAVEKLRKSEDEYNKLEDEEKGKLDRLRREVHREEEKLKEDKSKENKHIVEKSTDEKKNDTPASYSEETRVSAKETSSSFSEPVSHTSLVTPLMCISMISIIGIAMFSFLGKKSSRRYKKSKPLLTSVV